MNKEETLNNLAQGRQTLYQTIQGLSEEEMTQVPVEGTWTVKDVLGHLSAWEEVFLKPLRRYADGAPFETEVVEDYLAWNDEQAARKKSVPLNTILNELTSVRQELVAAASRLSDEQWKESLPFPWGGEGTVDRALNGLQHHELEHMRVIQEWREGQG
jgi:uncharacterized damage-inducible protein DinB